MENLERDVVAKLGSTALPLIEGLLAQAANPAGAANGLDRFLSAAGSPTLARLRANPRQAQPLLVIFSQSQFLSEALIQNPELADWLDQARQQDRIKQPEELAADLAEEVASARPEARALALTRFKRREYLRIVLRDLEGLATLAETTLELSNLADALLAQAYAWSWNDLVARFGTPMTAAARTQKASRDAAASEKSGGAARAVAAMVVLGLGKLGGQELNYSSDIDLLFVYTADGETDGHGAEGTTTNREFFTRMAQETVRYVSSPTPEGMAYRVDLRLRPGGREGEIALPVERALAYYRREARQWELQMLIKARPCAGQARLGRELTARLNDCVYPKDPGLEVIAAVRMTRERISAQMDHGRSTRRRSDQLDVKLDPGGIRDIEFLTQGLQRRHGGRDAWVRAGNTLQALQRLHDKRRLAGGQFQILSSAYTLLREVEHRLQLRLGQQTHSLPADPEQRQVLARSLAAPAMPGRRTAAYLPAPTAAGMMGTPEWLERELERVMSAVRSLFEHLLPAPAEAAAGEEFRLHGGGVAEAAEAEAARRLEDIRRDLAPALSARGRQQLERLLASIATRSEGSEALVGLTADQRQLLAQALDSSDFLADALALRPAQIECVTAPLLPADDRQLELVAGAAEPAESELADWVLPASPQYGERMRLLRLRYQERVCRYIAGEIAAPPPVRTALRRLTRWADNAIRCALRIASELHQSEPRQLAILALGRLGLREFDLFSDVDLVFVAEESDLPSAARLATTILEVLGSYTQEGAVFPVDARLRPEGTQGELVYTPRALAEYFHGRANVWEAASYLKARALAGGEPLATRAAAEVHAAIRARFAGRGGLRDELRAMRARIEREARSGASPLKTGPGGTYDVDFILSSIALANAGIALPMRDLATTCAALGEPPAPLLAPALAQELSQWTTLLRSADHALRIAAGKAPQSIPSQGHVAATASQWLARSLRRPLLAGGLAAEVRTAGERLRAIYEEFMR